MLRDKKGQENGVNFFLYIFYIALILMIAFVISLFQGQQISSVNKNYFDKSLQIERIVSFISHNDLLTQRTVRGVSDELKPDIFYFESYKKPFAFNATLGEKEIIGNEGFYRRAKPLAPVAYDLIEDNFPFDNGIMKIELLFSKDENK